VSIHRVEDGVHKVRWREGGRNRSLIVHGSHELAKKILRKKLSARDENRHLDVRKETNYRMSALIDRYWVEYANNKASRDREKSILEGIGDELGRLFVRELADGTAIDRWYRGLVAEKGLSQGTAVRHFNVMHHMMAKASTIWSKETGIDRNPADLVEVKRPDDQRERYLAAEEITILKATLDEKMYRKAGKGINQTFFRLRLIVLTALTTGMRIAEIFGLKWSDLLYREELIAVRAKLKGGKVRYVPMPPELTAEFRRYPAILGEERIFPPEPGAKRERQRVDKSFETILDLAGIKNFRFHDLRHTFASWYMMNGGDLYELAKVLGHSNIKMTERYAKLAKSHIARTGSRAREMWRLMEAGMGSKVSETGA
jgi:integrase